MIKSFAITVDELRKILNTFEGYKFVSMSVDDPQDKLELYVEDECIVIQKYLKDEFYFKEVS